MVEQISWTNLLETFIFGVVTGPHIKILGLVNLS